MGKAVLVAQESKKVDKVAILIERVKSGEISPETCIRELNTLAKKEEHAQSEKQRVRILYLKQHGPAPCYRPEKNLRLIPDKMYYKNDPLTILIEKENEQERLIAFTELVQVLNDEEKEIFMRYYFDRQSQKFIGECLNLSQSSVSLRLDTIKDKIKPEAILEYLRERT